MRAVFRVKHLYLLVITSILLIVLSSCDKDYAYIKRSKAFYINDNANVLLQSTKYTIYFYGKMLYEDSLKRNSAINNNIDSAQVVVLTYAGSKSDFYIPDLFNAWGIGKNDMGILLILYFDKVRNELIFNGIGPKMSGFMSGIDMDLIIDNDFYENLNLYDDIEYSLISLYFGILEYIYLYVYGYQSYDYYSFIDQYLDNQYTYNDPLPGETKTLIDYLPMWAWISIIIVFVVIGYKSGIIEILIQFLFRTKSEKSGGGKSIGYWSKR